MIILSNAAKNIRRYSRKSALYVLICVIAVMTLQIYIASIERTEKQLADLPAAMPVLARVASLDGSSFAALQIRPSMIDGLQISPHVRDLQMSIALISKPTYFPCEYGPNDLARVVAANSTNAVEGLKQDGITWLPGYNPEIMNGSDAVCIAGESNFMVRCDWSLGDIITLDLRKYKYDTRSVLFDEIGTMDVRIVGTTKAFTAGEFVMPFETVWAFARDMNVELPASAASFYVRDALQLNDFKAEMKKLYLGPAITNGSVWLATLQHSGVSLSVYDAAFISAATQLQSAILLLRGFLPLMVAVLAIIGYFVAYMMIQNRREEYAVLRLIGMSRRAVVSMYFCEMAFLTLGGSFVGASITTASGIGSATVGSEVFLLFSMCFILGSAIALFRISRTNVMLALSRRD